VTARSPAEFAGVVVAVALVPAVCEELLFRGLVQKSMEQAAGALPGAVVTGIIFGAYHLNPLSVVPLVVLGVFFGYLVVRTGSTTLAVAAHFFNNFIACTAVYLKVNDDFIALSPSGHPSASLVLVNIVLFGLVFLASLAYLTSLSRDRSAI
jgi:membrane protease YdiL (CAAX protease family)